MEIKVVSCCYERVPEISWYNHNYYKLKNYGDWFFNCFDKELFIYEVCEEDENCYTTALGYFEGEKFVKIFDFTNTQSAVED